MENKNTLPTDEIHLVMAGAGLICQMCNLPEVCSESLLRAILDNDGLTANMALVKTGINMNRLKKLLTKRLRAKAFVKPVKSLVYSVAVEGLLILNRMDRANENSSIHLLTTIIKNNNTAAARLLKAECISLNTNDQLIYKPLTK